MSLKRIRTTICVSIVLLLIMILAGVVSVPLVVIPCLENRLIPELTENAGLPAVQCRIRRLGLTGMDLGTITIGRPPAVPLELDSVQIDYSLPGLIKGEIRQILISGVTLYGDIQQDRIRLRGLDISDLLASDEKAPPSSPARNSFPFRVKTLMIRNMTLVFQWEDIPLRLPCEMQAILSPDGRSLQGRLRLFPRGQVLCIEAAADLATQTLDLTLNGSNLQTARFADWTHRLPGLTIAGRFDIRGTAEIRWNPFIVAKADGQIDFMDEGSSYRALRTRSVSRTNGGSHPVTLSIQKENGTPWRLHLNEIPLEAPFPMSLHDTHAALTLDAGGVNGSGRTTLVAGKTGKTLHLPFQLEKPLEMQTAFNAVYRHDGKWEFELNTPPDPPPPAAMRFSGLAANEVAVAGGLPTMHIQGEGTDTGGQLTAQLLLPGVEAETSTSKIAVSILTLDTRSDLSWKAQELEQQTTVTITALQPKLKTASVAGRISKLVLQGQWDGTLPAHHRFTGQLDLTDAELRDSRTGTELRDISLNLPIRWPPVSGRPKGKLAIASIRQQKKEIGSLHGFVQQKDIGLAFGIQMDNRLIPAIIMEAKGHATLEMPDQWELECRLQLSSPTETADIDWGKLWPPLAGLETSGGLQAETVLHWTPDHMTRRLKAVVRNTDLLYMDGDLAIRGMNTALHLPYLMPLRSAPAQQLRFEALELDKLKLTEGRVDYKIEDIRSFLVESCNFKWCSGNVNTEAFRIHPDIEDYNLTLYCDRLNLAMLLEQMGIGIARGEGTVNGRIPVRLHNGKITFDDAFLYSTPGQGGHIRLEKTETLTIGIPEGSPQANQLALVREALKDFEYDWAKVSLMTQDDHLLLKLQFDGKPTRPLPFHYKKEFGGFVRVEADSPGSKFQGIRLDINFNLPLDRILQYMDIFENIQFN
jgi:hypothetical protein